MGGGVINPKFTLPGQDFEFEEDMTWAEFIDSKYNKSSNTTPYFKNTDGYVFCIDPLQYVRNPSSTTSARGAYLATSIKIVADTTYTTTDIALFDVIDATSTNCGEYYYEANMTWQEFVNTKTFSKSKFRTTGTTEIVYKLDNNRSYFVNDGTAPATTASIVNRNAANNIRIYDLYVSFVVGTAPYYCRDYMWKEFVESGYNMQYGNKFSISGENTIKYLTPSNKELVLYSTGQNYEILTDDYIIQNGVYDYYPLGTFYVEGVAYTYTPGQTWYDLIALGTHPFGKDLDYTDDGYIISGGNYLYYDTGSDYAYEWETIRSIDYIWMRG